tara:strand:+ start:903 stop:1559 length:657 start_codon:yes stop_codon:yes gene_type:complete
MDFKDFEELSYKYFSTGGSKKLREKSKDVLTSKANQILNVLNEDDKVVDAGCGGNQFKTIFPNLVAFDMVDYGNQDFVSTILDAPIEKESQDAVLCFGVLHECPNEYHKPNIEKMLSWLKSNGQLIMKCKQRKVINKHPGMDLIAKPDVLNYQEYFDQGMWSKERIDQFTEELNLKINWIRPIKVSRKQQWFGNSDFESQYDDDIVFDGYVWSWGKNV